MAGSFLSELKRRKVYRVGVGYAAVMFVALQAADLLLAAMGNGDRLFRLLVVLAVAGFPVALVLAWLFEITPDGVMITKDGEDSGPPVSRGWQAVWAGALVVSAAVVGGTGWWFLRNVAETPSAQPEASVAVLDAKSLVVTPFLNLSGDESEEYFSDGMTDAVITGLARVRELSVTSRTSSFALKNTPMTHGEIAEELGVSSILAGSVRKTGETVRVDVNLADARNGFEIWTERYERPLSDVFQVQDEIARSIVRVLEVTLAERPDSSLIDSPTVNAMAYDKFLWGDYNRNKRTPEGLRDAVGNYEDAISRDQDYAEAHAGLAHALIALAGFPSSPRTELINRAQASVDQALELDPDLPSGRAARGLLLLGYDYDWDAAERELRAAADLAPQSAEVRQLLARTLVVRGRADEAREHAVEAVRLDRLSAGALADAAVVFHATGDADGALTRFDGALHVDPAFEEAVRGKVFVLLAQGRAQEAGEALATDGSPASAVTVDAVLNDFQAGGGATGSRSSHFVAPLLALDGRVDEAVEMLAGAHAARTLEPLDLARALAIPAFRESPRAQTFLTEIGLRGDA